MPYVVVLAIVVTPVSSRTAAGGLHLQRNNGIHHGASLGVRKGAMSGIGLKSCKHSQY